MGVTTEPVDLTKGLASIAADLREASEIVRRQRDLLERAHDRQELRRRVEREKSIEESSE